MKQFFTLIFAPLKRIALFDARLKRRAAFIYLALLIYGVVCACVIVSRYDAVDPALVTPDGTYCYEPEYMSVRQNWLNGFIEETRAAGRYEKLSTFVEQNSAYFFYLSLLGASNGMYAWQLFLLVQMIAAGLAVALYPVLTYKAFHSVICSLLSPVWMFLFMKDILLVQKTDGYWAMLWIVYLGLPMLYALLTQPWRNIQYAWLALLFLLCGLSNLPRAHAALGVMAAAVLVLIVKLWPFCKHAVRRARLVLRLAACLVAALVSYKLFTDVVPDAYELATRQPKRIAAMGPWHSFYIGLGWEENPFGLYYADACGFEAAAATGKLDGVSEEAYLPAYIDLIGDMYFDLVRENPKWVATSYLRKTGVAVSVAAESSKAVRRLVLARPVRFAVVCALAAVCMLAVFDRAAWRTFMKRLLMLLSIFLVVEAGGLLQGVIAIPRPTYLNGAIGAFDAGFFLLGALVASSLIECVLRRASQYSLSADTADERRP